LTPIPNPAHPFVEDAHFRKWAWADEQGWIKYYRLPFTKKDGWTRYVGNPIFEGSGVAGAFDEYGASYPSVVKLDGYYYLFYTGIEDTVSPGIYGIRIGVARSEDGITGWERYTGNPILEPVPGTWESVYVRVNSVYYDEEADRLNLYYQGYDGSIVRCGLAYRDGKDPFGAWTKYPGNPIISYAEHRGNPAIMRFGNLRYLCTIAAGRTEIRAYTAPDDVTFEEWGTIFSTGTAPAWDDALVNYANIFWNLGVSYVFYLGQNADATERGIGITLSFNPLSTYAKWARNPVWRAETKDLATYPWKTKVMCPYPLMVNDRFYIYYAGSPEGWAYRKIGYATIP